MKKLVIALLFITTPAFAQWGSILDKAKKGAKVLTSATKEFTEDEEADIGRVVAARVLATYPLAKNEKLQKYVTLVGNTVAAYSARPTLEWHFAVLETDVVNAFSCPGGFIFITTGALDQIDSEAELAAVLGHEIAHATQKHILKEIKRSNMVGAGLDLAQSTTLGDRLNDDLARKVSEVAYQKLFTTGLSRRDELEADKIGVELAETAGYRASEMLTFLDRLEAIEGSSDMKVILATHPSPADRHAAIEPLVREKKEGALLAERFKISTR